MRRINPPKKSVLAWAKEHKWFVFSFFLAIDSTTWGIGAHEAVQNFHRFQELVYSLMQH